MKKLNLSAEKIKEMLMGEYSLSEEEVKEKIEKYY